MTSFGDVQITAGNPWYPRKFERAPRLSISSRATWASWCTAWVDASWLSSIPWMRAKAAVSSMADESGFTGFSQSWDVRPETAPAGDLRSAPASSHGLRKS